MDLAFFAKQTQFRVVEDGTLQEDAGRVRKGSGARVMDVLRSLIFDLCSFSGKASLAAANRHDRCHPEKSVELVVTSIGKRKGSALTCLAHVWGPST